MAEGIMGAVGRNQTTHDAISTRYSSRGHGQVKHTARRTTHNRDRAARSSLRRSAIKLKPSAPRGILTGASNTSVYTAFPTSTACAGLVAKICFAVEITQRCILR